MENSNTPPHERLQNAISIFASILSDCIQKVRNLAKNTTNGDETGFENDWAQATWEMLVEASVSSGKNRIFLDIYGEGADCNGASSRVWCPGAKPTHAVYCIPKSGSIFHDALTGESFKMPIEGWPLEEFVTMSDNGWYRPDPPFDHVLLDWKGMPIVVRLKDVCFALGEPYDVRVSLNKPQ